MITLYVDAGTKNNGRRGSQKTTIAVCTKDGTVVFEKYIGDYTNNEGEILAIIAALKNVLPGEQKKILSDSKIAVSWVEKGWGQKARNRHFNTVGSKLHNRLGLFVDTATDLFNKSNSSIKWIPRERNKAGWYLEEKYGI